MDKVNKQLNTLINEVRGLKEKIKELEKRIPTVPKVDLRSVDELYEDVKKEIIKAGKVSTSYIQRKFGLGYSRSASLIDMLEEKGIIGPSNGANPRKVLITLVPTKGKSKKRIKKEIIKQLKAKGISVNKK